MMRMPVRMTMRAAVVAVVIGMGLQTNVADAGCRTCRIRAPKCGVPGCSVPLYVASPAPVCAYGNPAFSTGSAWPGFPQGYGGLPMAASNPAYGPSPYGDFFGATYGPGLQPGYAGPQPGYAGAQPGNVSLGMAPPPQGMGFGGPGGPNPGFGQGPVMPSSYAPVPFHYTPVPPAPGFDLVW